MIFNEVNFDKCPFWIQFHDVPLEAMDVENARILGAMIGEVVMVEDPNKEELLMRNYLRTKVVVDLKKPLITRMWTPRLDSDPVWIKDRYERLQNFCFCCGRLGHDWRSCFHRDEDDNESPKRFGNWLSILGARNIMDIISYDKEKWEEVKPVVRKGEAVVDKVLIMKKGIKGGREDEAGGSEGEKEQASRSDANYDANSERGQAELVNKVGTVVEENQGHIEEERKGKERSEKRKEVCVAATNKPSVDLSKAIVVYGSSSPLTEVTTGLKKVKLKCRLEEEEPERLEAKGSKLCFNDSPKISHSAQQVLMEVEGRRNVGAVKRQIRRGGSRRGGSSAGRGGDKENWEAEKRVGHEEKAEGCGGWPLAATKRQRSSYPGTVKAWEEP